MKTHDLKTWPEYYEAVYDGSKPFEARKNDRNYQVGDVLNLREWDPNQGTEGLYTGRSHKRTITYILDKEMFVQPGYVILGLNPVLMCEVCGDDNLDDHKVYGEVEICRRCYVSCEHAVDLGRSALEAAQKHMTSLLMFNGLWKKLAKTLWQKIRKFDEACGFGDYDDGRTDVPEFYKQMGARLMDILPNRDEDVAVMALAQVLWDRDRRKGQEAISYREAVSRMNHVVYTLRCDNAVAYHDGTKLSLQVAGGPIHTIDTPLQFAMPANQGDLKGLSFKELDDRIVNALSFLQIDGNQLCANLAFDALYEIQERRNREAVVWAAPDSPFTGAEVWELLKENRQLKEPMPLLLTCPFCNKRHVDEGDFATKVHHTHACQFCGMCWRPAIQPTCGVQFLPGFKNKE